MQEEMKLTKESLREAVDELGLINQPLIILRCELCENRTIIKAQWIKWAIHTVNQTIKHLKPLQNLCS